MDNFLDVAVVGASGLVGAKVLDVLKRKNFPVKKLILFSSDASKGKKTLFLGKEVEYLELNNENIVKNRADIAFFCVESEISRKFAPLFVALGSVVIDNSSNFRLNDDVPLVIPSINGDIVNTHSGIISNPNCSTIIALSVLAPLHKKYGLKRVIFSTYQAVSGAGRGGILSLENDKENVFDEPITNNVIPRIGKILPNGYTEEEQKMIDESKKILCNSSLAVSATAVRVPVYYGHAVSINAQFCYSGTVADIKETLTEGGIIVCDCPTPKLAENNFEVFAGRIRRDYCYPDTFNLWAVSDNTLKGAALNAVEIAMLL